MDQRSAFEAQLSPILNGAYGLARSLTGNPADGEDLLQEAALRAFRGFDSFRPGTNFKAWFYKILIHTHYETHRRAGRRPATVELESVPALYLYSRSSEAGLYELTEDPAKLVLSKLTTEQVQAAFDELPEEYGAVARLYFSDELEYREIAELLGCPVGTVRSRLHRGRKMLQKLLWSLAESTGVLARAAPGVAG